MVNKNTSLLGLIMAGLAGILVLRSVFSFLRIYLSSIVGEKIVYDLRRRVYEHIPRLSLVSINRVSPAQILTRITQDVECVRRFLFRDMVEFIYSGLNIGFILIVLLVVNPKLTALALLTLPLFAVTYFHLIPELKERNAQLRSIYGLLSSRMNEVLNGIRVVRSFAKDADETILFKHKQRKIFKAAAKMHYLNSWLWVGIEFFTSLGVIGILWVGGRDVMAGRMTAGELVAFYTYLGMLFSPIVHMVVINSSYQEALAALSRVNDVMVIHDEVSHGGPSAVSGTGGPIVLKNVSFHYTRNEPVLTDINCTIEPGEMVGIVGASGAGKTTLISLLLRFFDPVEGSICIGETDLRNLDLDGYRRNIAVVLQDDFLFSGTIEDNIKYGRPQASGPEIIQAAEIARAHAFIAELPDGYKTQIGERGVNLSCGQRQRIAIARAVIKNPSVLILDEATSSIDALTENEIQKSVRRFMKGKTVLMVAHRFSTIMGSDRIIVLDKGRIVESGSHNNLLNKKGFYSNLYLEQFQTEDRPSLLEA